MPVSRLMGRVRKAVRLLSDPVFLSGLRLGVGAAIEHEAALRPLDLRSLVDVGANKGQFSLLVRSVAPSARIHAFEPLPRPGSLYLRLFSNDPQVTLYPVALGESAGTAIIHISGREDSSSLLPISATQDNLFPGTAEAGQAEIRVERGDDVLAGIDLPHPLMVKLDVQGFELSALRGLTQTLARADYVYAEISFLALYEGQPLADEIIDWLRSNGFRLAGIYNLTLSPEGASVQADALFTRC